jgi:isocitrate/isopropylmalate dehydrogenase
MPSVCVIPGEDAAAEAVEATVALLQRLDLGLELRWLRTPCEQDERGAYVLTPEARRQIDQADATLFGATAGPAAPALFYLRWGKATFANVRPTRWTPGMPSPLSRPDGIDFVIVRENLEDAYLGLEGDLADLGPLGLVSRTLGRPPQDLGEGAYALKAITRAGSERVIRFAFELARSRRAEGRPGRVTASAKFNMLPRTDGLFIKVAQEIAADFPEIGFETLIVDDCAHRLVRDPHRFDVLVLPNLYGDVLSDAAAALTGGLGVAASGCYGADYAYFESAHGTAPDIAGQGVVNPTATLLSAAMMLDYLGLAAPAAKLRRAIEAVYVQAKALTPDVGGRAGTTAFCDAVFAAS